MFMRTLPSSFSRPGIALVAALGAAGCADPQDGREPAGTESAAAAIVVSRTVSDGRDARDSVRESVVARFVRARQGTLDDAALRLAGLLEPTPALATCMTVQRDASEGTRPTARPLELLDVGALAVEGPTARTLLLPRAMPDPAGVVSGVFYTAGASRSGQALAADAAFGGSGGYAGARLTVEASGGDGVEGFSVTSLAPRDITSFDASLTEQGLDLTWDEGDADGVVYADVLASTSSLRCTMLDTGRFVVPAALLPSGTARLVPGESQIALHRVRREPLRVRGVEPGELRFDIARVVTLRP